MISQVGAVILNKTDPDGNVWKAPASRLQQKNGDSWKELKCFTDNKIKTDNCRFRAPLEISVVETKAPDGFVKNLTSQFHLKFPKQGKLQKTKGNMKPCQER